MKKKNEKKRKDINSTDNVIKFKQSKNDEDCVSLDLDPIDSSYVSTFATSSNTRNQNQKSAFVFNIIKDIAEKLKYIKIYPRNSGFEVIVEDVEEERKKINVYEIVFYMAELDLDEETYNLISNWCYNVEDSGNRVVRIDDILNNIKSL